MQPICIGCGKTPEQLQEYIDAAEENDLRSPSAYVRQEEGTYNPENGHFLCTECYFKAGAPSGPNGWRAP